MIHICKIFHCGCAVMWVSSNHKFGQHREKHKYLIINIFSNWNNECCIGIRYIIYSDSEQMVYANVWIVQSQSRISLSVARGHNNIFFLNHKKTWMAVGSGVERGGEKGHWAATNKQKATETGAGHAIFVEQIHFGNSFGMVKVRRGTEGFDWLLWMDCWSTMNTTNKQRINANYGGVVWEGA